jgi:hypothetical protein
VNRVLAKYYLGIPNLFYDKSDGKTLKNIDLGREFRETKR